MKIAGRMTTQPSPPTPSPSEPRCLVRSVADAFAREPTLEAVTVDNAQQTVSVATLGPTNEAQLIQRVHTALTEARRPDGEAACGLLEGRDNCASCEHPLSAREQAGLRIQREGNVTTIARVTCVTAPRFWHWRVLPLPRLVQRDVEFWESAEHADEWKPKLLAAGLCGVFGVAAWWLSPGWLGQGLFVLAYVAGAWFTVGEIAERLRRGKVDVHFLMLAVALGSASIGAWAEGATLLFLFSLSSALEHYALGRTQREIRALFRNAPKTATLLDAQGRESEVPVAELRPGMRLIVRPGAQFPVDAEIVHGTTAADESNLTGEATPVDKRVGDAVLAGTINLWGTVQVAVTHPASESTLQKIILLIREAQHLKASAQRFTDRFGTGYTYTILGLTAAMFFVWWLGLDVPPLKDPAGGRSAFYRAMTLLVVASPCALVLSIPSAVLAAIAWGARRGVLFRGGAAVEKLAEIEVVALDKTGTLTTGDLAVDRVESFPAGHEREVAQLAYSLERLSAHPLARAIARYGTREQLEAVTFEHFESVTGQGLVARRDGREYRVGRREWVVRTPDPAPNRELPDSPPGHAEVWVSADGLLGRITLRDAIRPQSRAVVEALRRAGLQTIVLTGDRRAAAEILQRQLGLDDVRAELKPEEKVAVIQALAQQHRRVAMVGDGVNDAPSLAAAHVGVAMGARGADAALEQAEVVLMNDRLENFLAAFRLSQRARRVIRQNLVISLGTVVILVAFALLGGIPLTVGVVGHEGSTVLVVMNSLRLLFDPPGAVRHPVVASASL